MLGRVKNEQTKGCNKVRVENNIAIGLGLVEHQAVFPKFYGVSQEMFFWCWMDTNPAVYQS